MLNIILSSIAFTFLINWAISLHVTIPTVKEKNIKSRLIILVYLIVFIAGLIILSQT
jgi:hypothetical protein